MTQRIAALAICVACATLASASIDLQIDQPYRQVFRPSSGTFVVTFSGTIDVSETFDAGPTTLTFPATSSHTLSGDFHPDLFTYLALGAGADYQGNLFTIEVEPDTPMGEYFYVTGQPGTLCDFLVGAVDGPIQINDREFYGIAVVPEPTALTALGVGALSLLRRRRS